jgi:hypothetical protein
MEVVVEYAVSYLEVDALNYATNHWTFFFGCDALE